MTHGAAAPPSPRPELGPLALVIWGYEIDDFLSKVSLSIAEFAQRTTGSWIFPFAEAMRRSGWSPFVLSFSSSVAARHSFVNERTGLELVVLPVPGVYRWLRRRFYPYGRVDWRLATTNRGRLRLAASEAMPYLSTPVRLLVRELRRRRCAAIIHQEYEMPRFDVFVAVGRVLHIPVVGIFQGSEAQRGRLERVVRPRALRGASGLIIGSGDEAARVEARYALVPSAIARIPNPVDTDAWTPGGPAESLAVRGELGLPSDAGVVVWHGRVSIDHKGLDVLVEAFAHLARRRPDLRPVLLLIGAGYDDDPLDGLIAGHPDVEIRRITTFLDGTASLRRLLAAGDVYVLASRHEGFPLSAIEAIACGLPLVATDVAGAPEIVGRDEPAGLLVPRGDHDAMEAAIERLLADAELRLQLGEAGRRRAQERFSYEAVGSRVTAFIRRSQTSR